MRRAWNAGLLVTIALIGCGGVPSAQNDHKALQGVWEGGPDSDTAMWTFEGDKVTIADGNGQAFGRYIFTVDVTTTPKTMKFSPIPGDATIYGGPLPKGIYAISGDTLTVRTSGVRDVKPTRFETIPGDDPGSFPLILKRKR